MELHHGDEHKANAGKCGRKHGSSLGACHGFPLLNHLFHGLSFFLAKDFPTPKYPEEILRCSQFHSALFLRAEFSWLCGG
jgi:hypothetical protein